MVPSVSSLTPPRSCNNNQILRRRVCADCIGKVVVMSAALSELLRHLILGKCNKGAACTYAHSAAELRATEKTVMCIWWLSGHCSHGSKCR